MSKSSLLKNARNYAEYLRKKERGPVKAFFHITKNENVPAIEQQGLLTNHPNANINSANHPFRKHGTDAGGVWVTTEPTAFPVYGTTIGGKNGNSAARADATKYLTSNLGRQPTAEEIDNWARIGLVNKIEVGDVDVPPVVADWAYKYNEDIVKRLTHELDGD